MNKHKYVNKYESKSFEINYHLNHWREIEEIDQKLNVIEESEDMLSSEDFNLTDDENLFDYQVKLEKSVIKDLKKIKHSGLKNKFDDIMKTLKNNPYEPTHSFEKLVPRHEGYYSRRLNIQHRIVYKIDSEI